MFKGVSHIGIAVENLDKAIEEYKAIGLTCSGIEVVEEQKVRVAFIETGGTRIELLESTDPEGPIGKHITKRGPGMHHMALEVTELQNHLSELEGNGVRLIDKVPRKGAHNMNIAFVHPKAVGGTLLELCEKAENSEKEA